MTWAMAPATAPAGMPVFRPIVLPPTAFARTWWADLLSDDGLPYAFRGLLRRLAPEMYRNLSPEDQRSPFVCYKALLAWLSGRIPIEPYAIDRVEEVEALTREGHPDAIDQEDWYERYIPVEVFGNDYEDLTYQASPAKALLLYEYQMLGLAMDEVTPPQPHRQALTARPANAPHAYPKPPRGRRWAGPWANLPDLLDWMTGSTQNPYCDFSENDAAAGGVEMAPWTVEDVRSLMQQWHDAKRIMTRADVLADFIDHEPKRWLPVLSALTRNDKAALRQVTEPVRVKAARTLIQVLA